MKRLGFILGAVLLPTLASAQDLGGVETLFTSLGGIVATLLPIVVALGLLAFFWGLVKFIFSAGDESAKDAGKRIMIWGLIALFVMVSVWGLVGFIQDSLGIDPDIELDSVPTVPGL